MSQYINLNRLEYIVTYQCSSNCRHCYATGEPSGSPTNINHIDAHLAVHVLREIGKKYALTSVMTFGGEPLLYPQVVCAIHQEAQALDIPHRSVITNGYWTKDEDKTQAIARSLARSGVNQVSISVDAFHQEHVPLERVKRSAQVLWDAGIRDIQWNPCWLVSERDANEYNLTTRAILDELEGFLPIKIDRGNVVEPQGKALVNLGAYFQPAFDWPRTSCQEIPYMDRLDDIRCLCVEPNGDIPVCGFLIGNAARDDINDILEHYDPYQDAYLKLILEQGIEGVVRQARSLGLELRENGYYSICDLCTSLGRELAEAMRKRG